MFGLSPLLAKLLGIGALVAVLGGAALWLRSEIRAGARLEAALDTATKANASLVDARARAVAEADAERERAMARQRERDGLAASVAALRQSLGDSLGACRWTDEQAKAVDEFLRGQR